MQGQATASLPTRTLVHRRCSCRSARGPRAVKASATRTASYSNPIGVHALVFSGDWSEESARRAASGATQAGYDLVEIPAFNADTLDIDMTASVFREHGVRAACSLGLSLDADISSTDREVVAKGAAQLEKALAFAFGIGAQHLCGILYSALAKYPQPPTAQGRKNCIEQLQQLATKAEHKGVKLCLEVVNR